MSIRLWPQDYERKEHISKAERTLLRNAARNFKSGHLAVGIDPVGLSTATAKMGMYISPKEGLITYTINTGQIDGANISAYKMYVDMVESSIYERLLDSKVLIVRNGDNKALRFPYKHVIMFSEVKLGKTALTGDQQNELLDYATLNFFRPVTSNGKEKTISQLRIFSGVRKAYDSSYSSPLISLPKNETDTLSMSATSCIEYPLFK